MVYTMTPTAASHALGLPSTGLPTGSPVSAMRAIDGRTLLIDGSSAATRGRWTAVATTAPSVGDDRTAKQGSTPRGAPR